MTGSAGLASSVAEVQALALTTIAKVVQMAKPEQIRGHLPDLVAALLESLSGMEVSAASASARACVDCPPARGAGKRPVALKVLDSARAARTRASTTWSSMRREWAWTPTSWRACG